MTIFNSLGSNYVLRDALLALRELIWPNQKSKIELKKKLESEFVGKAVLLFGGRDAIEYCLKAYGVKRNDSVLTQAFSCSSIEEAINRTGARAEYFDLSPGSIKSTITQVEQAYARSKNPKVLILQHGLGYVDDVEQIKEFCLKKKLILIEDLAQAVGAVDSRGNKVGSFADAIILSFGRDKILDAISGGAVIFKSSSNVSYTMPRLIDWFELSHDWKNKRQVLKLLLYPTLTLVIRSTYSVGLGKLIHRLAQKSKLMESSIISSHSSYQSFPAYFAPLAINKLSSIDVQLEHRRKISLYYLQELKSNKNYQVLVDKRAIKQGTNLRFPVMFSSPNKLSSAIKYLKTKNVFLADRWYKAPVDSASQVFASDYQLGSCPNAEKLSKQLLNLPTHQQIGQKEASKIIQTIKNWEKY